MRRSMDSFPKLDSEALEAEAARWVMKRDSGAWMEADQAELDAWLGERTEHRIAYIRLSAAWGHAARMKALGAAAPAGTIPPRGSWSPARFSRASLPRPSASSRNPEHSVRLRRTRLFAAAACVLALMGGAFVYRMAVLGGDIYATPVGGIETVKLADGSSVTLNTDTRIRVTLMPTERRIQLEGGEAFFQVAKDKSRPFVVYAANKRVIAVGTQFEVRRDHDDLEVIVTEGTVRLAPLPAAVTPTQPPMYLTAGDIARALKNEVMVQTHATAEAQKLLSWRAGYLIFDDTTLASAVAEFNRYSVHKISIADPSIATIRIGGHFRSNNTSGFLWLLQTGFPVTVDHEAGEVILRAR